MVRFLVIVLALLTSVPSMAANDRAKRRWLLTNPKIKEIEIQGNEALEASRIENALYSRVRGFLDFLDNRRFSVQRETLNQDTLEVKYLYLREGFLGVRVVHDFVPLGDISTNDDDQSIPAKVSITISEGRQFLYGNANISGSYDRTEFHSHFLSQLKKIKRGEPVNPFELNEIKTEFKTRLANNGYPYATVKFRMDTSLVSDTADVEFTVESDSIVYYGDIEILGATDYPASAARRELKLKPGELYQRRDILESQRRLFESGYYTSFQINQALNSADKYRPDFEVTVRERPINHLNFKTGAAQSRVRDLEWDISTGYGRRNAFGTRKYELLADYSFSLGQDSRLIGHEYSVRFTEPWLLGIRMPVSLTGSWEPRRRDAVQDFKIRRWSFSAVVNKRFRGDVIKVTVGGEYANVKITEASAAVEIPSDVRAARRSIYGIFRRDTRDDPFIPTFGSYTQISADYYGGFLGGSDNFYKVQTSWSRYQIVWPGWISATRVAFGKAQAFSDTKTVPLDEALYLGGANTIRGYKENRLGPLFFDENDPRDKGTPAGARYTVVLNQEFRWKTVQYLNWLPWLGSIFKKFPQWQSVFVDVGNGFDRLATFESRDLAVSIGTGLQIVSPAGPIRVDYAKVLQPEIQERWHFTILYAF